MSVFVTVVVCFLASLGAGLTTSLSGGSGTSVISPVLTVFLGVSAYDAVGIALASDVLASLAAAGTYARAGNVRIREALPLLGVVLAFTLVGSWVSSFLPNMTLGSFTVFMMLGMGVMFLRSAKKPDRPVEQCEEPGLKRWVKVVACGAGLGMLCGLIGAGGGIMVMLVLRGVLGYPFKEAVGTSTFVMAFTAAIGAIGHFAVGGLPAPLCLVLCVAFTTLFSIVGARFANRANTAVLKRVVGGVLVAMGAVMLVFWFVGL